MLEVDPEELVDSVEYVLDSDNYDSMDSDIEVLAGMWNVYSEDYSKNDVVNWLSQEIEYGPEVQTLIELAASDPKEEILDGEVDEVLGYIEELNESVEENFLPESA